MTDIINQCNRNIINTDVVDNKIDNNINNIDLR